MKFTSVSFLFLFLLVLVLLPLTLQPTKVEDAKPAKDRTETRKKEFCLTCDIPNLKPFAQCELTFRQDLKKERIGGSSVLVQRCCSLLEYSRCLRKATAKFCTRILDRIFYHQFAMNLAQKSVGFVAGFATEMMCHELGIDWAHSEQACTSWNAVYWALGAVSFTIAAGSALAIVIIRFRNQIRRRLMAVILATCTVLNHLCPVVRNGILLAFWMAVSGALLFGMTVLGACMLMVLIVVSGSMEFFEEVRNRVEGGGGGNRRPADRATGSQEEAAPLPLTTMELPD